MLRRYLLREVTVFFLLGVLLFVGLVTTDLLSSLSGVLLSRETPLPVVLTLVLYRLPYTLGVALPLGLVFAVLVALARMIRTSELKSAYAGGVPPLSLLWPLVALGAVVSVLVFANAAWVKPEAQSRFEAKLYQVYYGTQPSGVLYRKAFAPNGLGVYYAERIYPGDAGAELERVRIIDADGVIWSAERGRWEGARWILGPTYRVDKNGNVEYQTSASFPFPARYNPAFRRRDYEALPLKSLRQLARVDPKARFPLERRYADALGALVLVWLAGVSGLALRESSLAFALVVVLIFGYYVLWTLSARLFAGAIAGPEVAWLPDLVYGGLALLGTVRLR